MLNPDYLNVLEGTSPIRYVPEDFFVCNHGYGHYGDCPLCGHFDSAIVKAVDHFVETVPEELPMSDMVALAKFLERRDIERDR